MPLHPANWRLNPVAHQMRVRGPLLGYTNSRPLRQPVRPVGGQGKNLHRMKDQ